MNFPNDYFEDEVRDGFYIPTKMKIYWAAQMELLSQIDSICERHGLQYFAHYGTLLGAIRHGGFIPWDDDLDICMKRSDLERFIPIAREELPNGAMVLNYDEEDYSNLLVRVVNSRGINFDESFMKFYHGCPYVIGIDVFVIDNMAPNDELDKIQCNHIREVFTLASQIESADADNKAECCRNAEFRYKELIKEYRFDIDKNFSLKKRLHLLGEKFMSMYSAEECNRVADFGNRIHSGSHAYPRKYFEKAIRIPFETSTICVSPFYNDILRGNYGTYMKAVRGAAGHDYPVYSIADNVMLEAIGKKWMEPVFESDKVCERREYDYSQAGRLYDVTNQMINILEKINALIPALIKENDVNSLIEILQQAQTVAQKLGQIVEKSIHKFSSDIVGELEIYCEKIYRFYMYLTGDTPTLDFEKWCQECNACINTIIKYIGYYIDKKRILFLIRHKENIPQAIVGKYSDENKFEVYYESIERVYSGKSDLIQDIAGIMLDIIYTDDIFDIYNSSSIIDRKCFADNLRANCNQLVILPRIGLDEINSDKDSLYVTCKYLLNNIGSICADTIYASSDNMRKYYIDILSSFTGEIYRSIWEKKVCIFECVEDDVNTVKDKKLCFYISVASLMTYAEEGTAKLERILHIFDEYSEKIDIVWVWDNISSHNMNNVSMDYLENITKLLDELGSRRNIKKVEYKDLQSIVDKCVAYYGDACSLMNKFIRAKKPVMQMDLFC